MSTDLDEGRQGFRTGQRRRLMAQRLSSSSRGNVGALSGSGEGQWSLIGLRRGARESCRVSLGSGEGGESRGPREASLWPHDDPWGLVVVSVIGFEKRTRKTKRKEDGDD